MSLRAANNVVIKRDLPIEQRQTNNILLRERRDLINSGTDPKLIRIKNNTLVVDSKAYGSVINGTFTLQTGNTTTTDESVSPDHDPGTVSSDSTSSPPSPQHTPITPSSSQSPQ